MSNTVNSTKPIKKFSKRLFKDKLLHVGGALSVVLALSFLVIILVNIASSGYSVFQQTRIVLTLDFRALSSETWANTSTIAILDKALQQQIGNVTTRKDKLALRKLISKKARYTLQKDMAEHPEWRGQEIRYSVIAESMVDLYIKEKIDPNLLDKQHIEWIEVLRAEGNITKRFNTTFFDSGDSRNAEQAGVLVALKGSLYLMLITFILSFPIGIGAAIYLEEFAPKNRLTDFIEVNINNLAAVPSIIFGLLGLAIFINTFALPRSSPLVGGIVLSLMTLPIIIIASRAAIKAVPRSICDGAYALGASHMQIVMHHIVPLAMPGMLTGSIIGMAQALGESAPLMLIGMVAFIVETPDTITEPATALPIQIFNWAKLPEQGFVERSAGAIILLLLILFVINALAIFLRKRMEKNW